MQITSLEFLGKNTFKVEIEGVVLKIDDETVYREKLKTDDEVSPEKFEKLVEISEYAAAKKYLAAVLSRSGQSAKEADLKLMRKGFSKKTREKTIEFFEKNGYLDDELFAKSYVRYATEVKRQGRIKIKSDLIKKGVSNEIIELVLEGVDDSSALAAAAEKELAKTSMRDRKTLEKIKRRLYAKGYSIYDINDYFYALGGEDEI